MRFYGPALGLAVVVLVSVQIHAVNGLRCLQCDGITHPRFCQAVATCGAGEVCYAETVEATDSVKTYRLGCTVNTPPDICNATAPSDSLHCVECCSTDLCNAGSCGQKGYPDKRGPICYSCNSRLQNEPCNAIDFCGADEVCSVSQRVIFSETVTTYGCSQRHICESHIHSGVPHIIGKRAMNTKQQSSEDNLTPGNCHSCCDKDLCNTHCVMDACNPSPCRNGGTCSITGSGYICLCPSGLTGNSCEIDDDECLHFPCHNGGTCVNTVGGYNCVCPHGYSGPDCSIDVDVCLQFPCRNGGTCVNTVGGYNCVCPHWYSGPDCSIDVDECLQFPCRNGGTCVNTVGGYNCVCPHGYSGSDCSIDIDECLQFPCRNGRMCVNTVGGYNCVCPYGYSGPACTVGPVRDCLEVKQLGLGNVTGVYTIMIPNINKTLEVLCDMTTDGGGWTVFQYRFNGSVDFYRNFSEYEYGFGDVHGEYWLGLKYIQELTACQESVLRINLENAKGSTAYETFGHFSLNSSSYILEIDRGSGTAGDLEGLSYNRGNAFYTYDQDNNYSRGCAKMDHGGWWYIDCTHANLNGEYVRPTGNPGTYGIEAGMIYRDFDNNHSLKSTKMMTRRTGSNQC